MKPGLYCVDPPSPIMARHLSRRLGFFVPYLPHAVWVATSFQPPPANVQICPFRELSPITPSNRSRTYSKCHDQRSTDASTKKASAENRNPRNPFPILSGRFRSITTQTLEVNKRAIALTGAGPTTQSSAPATISTGAASWPSRAAMSSGGSKSKNAVAAAKLKVVSLTPPRAAFRRIGCFG